MNRVYLPLFLLLTGLSLQAQEFTSGWGLEVTPHISSRRLVAANQIERTEIKAIEAQERSSYGFGIGVYNRSRVGKIGTRWGVRYQQTGFDGNRREFPVDPIPQYAFTEIEYKAQIVEVPLYLDFYQDVGTTSNLFFSFGISLGVHFGQEYTTQPFDVDGNALTPVIADDSYRGFNFGFMTGMGYETQIGSGFVLGLSPQFQYWLLGSVISEEAELNRNLYNLGLRVTLMKLN